MEFTADDYPLDKNLSSFTEFHHWQVVNIQGNDWYNGDVVLDFLEPFQLPGLGKLPRSSLKYMAILTH